MIYHQQKPSTPFENFELNSKKAISSRRYNACLRTMYGQVAADRFRPGTEPRSWRSRRVSLKSYIFCFVTISIGCLEACFEACRQAHPERLFVFAPSSHGREPELQQRMQMPSPLLQKARCFALTLLSPLQVWFAWYVQHFWQSRCENWQRLVQILVAGAVFTVCVTPTEGERLVRQLWHYTPFTLEKTSKTGPACSV